MLVLSYVLDGEQRMMTKTSTYGGISIELLDFLGSLYPEDHYY